MHCMQSPLVPKLLPLVLAVGSVEQGIIEKAHMLSQFFRYQRIELPDGCGHISLPAQRAGLLHQMPDFLQQSFNFLLMTSQMIVVH